MCICQRVHSHLGRESRVESDKVISHTRRCVSGVTEYHGNRSTLHVALADLLLDVVEEHRLEYVVPVIGRWNDNR